MGRVNEETTKSGSFSSKRMRALFIVREIFSSTTVTGKLHYASTQEPPDSADERQLEADFFNTRVHVDVKNTEVEDQRKSTIGSKRHNSAVPNDRRSHKVAKETEMSGVLLAWTETLNSKREAHLAKANRYKKQASYRGL